MSDPSDPMPDEQLRFLRASVSDRCDLACVYCPKASGMENHVPDHLRERVLTPQAYATNLDRIAATGEIRGISFTGGEPTLNPYLPDLVAHAHTRFERVELTTNGRWLGSMLDRLVPYLHVVKVSLDAADPEVARRISRGRADAHQAAVEAIRMAADAGLTVGVNVVAMRDNLDQLAGIVDLVRGLRVDAPGRLYVSVLDLYHTPETHQVWAQQYVPIETVVAALRRRLGPGQRQDRKGCEIHWFDDAGFQIRVKSSSAYTYRAPRCEGCPLYCQEGFYSLKHSVQGWVTGCPTGLADRGTHLAADLSDDGALRRLAPLVEQLLATRRVDDSHQRFLAHHRLAPPTTARVPASETGHR